jgi:hypothetical protein
MYEQQNIRWCETVLGVLAARAATPNVPECGP